MPGIVRFRAILILVGLDIVVVLDVCQVSFPVFDDDNPKLWFSRYEDYFELYNLDLKDI